MFLVCTEFCVDVWGFTVSFVFYRIEPCFTASTDFLWSPPNCRSPSCSAEDRPFHLRPAPRLLLFLFAPSPLGFLLFFPRFPLFFFSGCIFFCFFGCFTFFSSFLSPSFSLQPLNVYSVPTALDFNVSLFFSFFFNQLWLFPLGRPVQRFSLLCFDPMNWFPQRRPLAFTEFYRVFFSGLRNRKDVSFFLFFFGFTASLLLRRQTTSRASMSSLLPRYFFFYGHVFFLFPSFCCVRSRLHGCWILFLHGFTGFYRVLPGFTVFFRLLLDWVRELHFISSCWRHDLVKRVFLIGWFIATHTIIFQYPPQNHFIVWFMSWNEFNDLKAVFLFLSVFFRESNFIHSLFLLDFINLKYVYFELFCFQTSSSSIILIYLWDYFVFFVSVWWRNVFFLLLNFLFIKSLHHWMRRCVQNSVAAHYHWIIDNGFQFFFPCSSIWIESCVFFCTPAGVRRRFITRLDRRANPDDADDDCGDDNDDDDDSADDDSAAGCVVARSAGKSPQAPTGWSTARRRGFFSCL